MGAAKRSETGPPQRCSARRTSAPRSHGTRTRSAGRCERVINGADERDAALIDAAVLDVLVHRERDGHALVEVVDHNRAARAAPERDSVSGKTVAVELVEHRILQRVP